jgi:hypothetical protein
MTVDIVLRFTGGPKEKLKVVEEESVNQAKGREGESRFHDRSADGCISSKMVEECRRRCRMPDQAEPSMPLVG